MRRLRVLIDNVDISRKVKRCIVIGTIFIGIVYCSYKVIAPFIAPWLTIKRFIHAVESENITKIVSFAVIEERKYCGVNEQSVKKILASTLGKWRPFKAIRVEKVPWGHIPIYKELGWHRWFVVWGDAVSGKPFPHSSGHDYPAYGITSSQLFTEVTVLPTDEGWKVFVTEFLIQLTYGVYGPKYLSMLHNAGIKGEVNVITKLTKPGGFMALPKP